MTSLYHTLRSQNDAVAIELTAAQKKTLIAKLKEIGQSDDTATKALIVTLIAEHAKVTGEANLEGLVKNQSKNLPYGMKQNQKDVSFDIANFDDQLSNVIWKFLNLEVLHPKDAAKSKSKSKK